jgi:uncharacterized protein with HEPN domain
MSQRDEQSLLRDMLQHARLAVQIAEGRSYDDLLRDRLFRAACERFVEIVGEAARNMPMESRGKYPGIPWVEIIATRNVLAHAYLKVDLTIIWTVLERDLPALIPILESLVGPDG